ncbi:MAG: hypothetical protein ACFFBP_01655 [Promethearchaeota archaeon]
MIRDIIIIKDGLPLYSTHFKNTDNTISQVFTQKNDIIMMTGFLSALNSFSEEFNNFGPIKELRLLNNDLKLSFVKDNTIPNLIYLATYDDSSKGVNVQRTLRKISRDFVDIYGVDQIENWSGKTDYFNGMNDVVDRYVNEEMRENERGFKEKVVDLFKNVEEKLNENLKDNKNEIKISSKEENIENQKYLDYYAFVPFFKTSRKINPRFYITGEMSHKIFRQINGEKSIDQIARELELKQEQVYNVCKNLVKIGFISLNMN